MRSQRNEARLINGVKEADQTPAEGETIFSNYPQIDFCTLQRILYTIRSGSIDGKKKIEQTKVTDSDITSLCLKVDHFIVNSIK